MSLLDRDEVPEPKSLASTRPVDSPRVAASSATPAPTIPPPTTSTSCSVAASLASASARSAGPSLTVVPPPAITVRTLPARAMPGAGRPESPRPRQGPHGQRRCALGVTTTSTRWNSLRSEYPEVAMVRRSAPIRFIEPSATVDGPCRILDGADRADLQPGAARQFRVVRLAAPVVAVAGSLRGAGERRADHHRVGAEREGL